MIRSANLNVMFTAGVSLLAFAAGTAQARTDSGELLTPAMAEAASTAGDAVAMEARAVEAGAEAGAAAEAEAGAEGLTDIVVTAERRDVSLQEAPLAVSAITSEALEASNITDITGLNGSVPGLVVARSGGGERVISIRGIGSETPENTNTLPGVSYHIDGVYIFNSIAASAAFIDVAQVEVLRGPQGTLFGQGSTGGTINVVTHEPSTDALSGRANIGLGNYSYVEADGALNVPVTDTLAVRAAINHVEHDGYAAATSVPGYDRYDLDDADETGWRLGAKWSPASNFSITLNTIQYRSDTHGPAQKNILDPEPDPRLLTQDYPGRSVVDTQLYTGVLRWETPFATIKSISSYQKLHSEQAWDADGLNSELFYDLTFSPVSFAGSRYDHVALWQSDTEKLDAGVQPHLERRRAIQLGRRRRLSLVEEQPVHRRVPRRGRQYPAPAAAGGHTLGQPRDRDPDLCRAIIDHARDMGGLCAGDL